MRTFSPYKDFHATIGNDQRTTDVTFNILRKTKTTRNEFGNPIQQTYTSIKFRTPFNIEQNMTVWPEERAEIGKRNVNEIINTELVSGNRRGTPVYDWEVRI